MLTLLLHIRTAWDDYFTGNPTTLQSNEYTSRESPSGTGVYVSNCLFRSITSSGSGALYCSSTMNLLIELTSFFSCKTSSYGGAIYFSSGQSILYEVCGYDCCSTSTADGQFVYIGVGDDASSKNYANYSSMIRCVNENSNSYYAFDLFYGIVVYSSVNSSMNKCGYGVNYCNPASRVSVTCLFSFCSFTDNIATSNTCIQLYRGNFKI
jgi:hypothetical protein